MTAPDWVPLMRRAAAVVTDSGGMTCHAAIVSRELGIPCVVGTGDATQRLRDGEPITVNATDGTVRSGTAAAPAAQASASASPTALAAPLVTGTRLLVNLSEPSQVEAAAQLPVDGVGLLRAELIGDRGGARRHPPAKLAGRGQRRGVRHEDGGRPEHDRGAVRTAPGHVPHARTSGRTSSGACAVVRSYEPEEANPMIGYRGALRYTRDPEVFALELEAIGRVWDAGHHNLHVMLPFVRTARELALCRALMAT